MGGAGGTCGRTPVKPRVLELELSADKWQGDVDGRNSAAPFVRFKAALFVAVLRRFLTVPGSNWGLSSRLVSSSYFDMEGYRVGQNVRIMPVAVGHHL